MSGRHYGDPRWEYAGKKYKTCLYGTLKFVQMNKSAIEIEPEIEQEFIV